MGVLRVKDGNVAFDRIDPAGFRILGALDRVARALPYDLTITCGSDAHGPDDPHTLGRAYDIRTSDLTPDQARYVLRAVLLDLQEGTADAPLVLESVPLPNLATRRFFGQWEHPGQSGQHLHLQQRKGVAFP